MKRLVILSILAAALGLHAQAQTAVQAQTQPQTQTEPQPRNFKLMVRNTRDRVMPEFGASAYLKGSSQVFRLDQYGNRYFKVTDRDTLHLSVGEVIYEFPLADLDSLYVTFRNPNRIAEVISRTRNNERIDIGYGTTTRASSTSAVTVADMTNLSTYPDLRSYLQSGVSGVSINGAGQLIIRGGTTIGSGNPEALIVLDGSPLQNFEAANSLVAPADVQSISVLKDAGATAIYGVRGANGVLLITTKRGGE